MERAYFDHGEWDDGLQPQRQAYAPAHADQFQSQAGQPQQQAPAIVVAQRAPDSAYQSQNYQTPQGYQPSYVDTLPQHLRTAAQIVRTTNPADIPSFPRLVMGIDRVVSMVPWWLVLAVGAGAGYWFATKRKGAAA